MDRSICLSYVVGLDSRNKVIQMRIIDDDELKFKRPEIDCLQNFGDQRISSENITDIHRVLA